MGKDQERIDGGLLEKGPLHLSCSATGDWTDGQANSVGTSVTSFKYQMKPADQVVIAISAGSDGEAIIILPSLTEAAGKFYFIVAPTGATAGDISLYEKETGAELTTNGDMDADDDHILLFSDGTAWRTILDGVA